MLRSVLSKVVYACPLLTDWWIRHKIGQALRYDLKRLCRFSGITLLDDRDALRAKLTMEYHGLEKGLTMPRRHFPFGQDAVRTFIDTLGLYIERFGDTDDQVRHGLAVLKDYRQKCQAQPTSVDAELMQKLDGLLQSYSAIPAAVQPHVKKTDFFACADASFPDFAKSRHALRHFAGEVSLDRIEQAVGLAMSSPSACNRQPTRIHCIVNKDLARKILSHQPGNRGFGDDADKVLVLTADLACLRWAEERHDLYLNAGMFAMNLSYALHYHKIAHCYLSCSIPKSDDVALRKLMSLKPSEDIVLMIVCGEAPEEFDVAASPKRDYREIFTVHG